MAFVEFVRNRTIGAVLDPSLPSPFSGLFDGVVLLATATTLSIELGNGGPSRILTITGVNLSYEFDAGGVDILNILGGTITGASEELDGDLHWTATAGGIDAATLAAAILADNDAAQFTLLIGGNDVIHGTDALFQEFGPFLLPGGDYLNGFTGNDSINGYAGDDILLGGDGRDTLNGGEGDDSLFGERSHDQLNGGRGIDILVGGFGNDTLNGGQGTDLLVGGVGNDVINGGDGFDFAVLGEDGRDIRVDLRSLQKQSTGEGRDRFVAVEGIVTQDGNDNLFGNGQNNILLSFGGDDALSGGRGDDTLAGGKGNDTMTGGEGADVFVFDSALDPAYNVDTIRDFVHGVDKVALSPDNFRGGPAMLPGQPVSVFAPGSIAFGTAPTTIDHRIVYDSATGQVSYDRDGTGAAATRLFALVTPGTVLTASDFTYVYDFDGLLPFA